MLSTFAAIRDLSAYMMTGLSSYVLAEGQELADPADSQSNRLE
ncbi:MAG: hypothetical protein QNK16_08590 [Woeseiaceae bacterium]|nr:hypothetical protein [Woeseiaceae bacterium]MDX2608424.1 hypothetical protein [Woeseiaceae bacterium]